MAWGLKSFGGSWFKMMRIFQEYATSREALIKVYGNHYTQCKTISTFILSNLKRFDRKSTDC